MSLVNLMDQGIEFRTDAAFHRIPSGEEVSDFDEFMNRGGELLDVCTPQIITDVIPRLEQYAGTWHPSGFMVFHMGTHAELGSLRLHIWPQDLRVREERGSGPMGDIWDGDIHDHSWFVLGDVLTGYKDTIYSVGTKDMFSDAELAVASLNTLFEARYRADNNVILEPAIGASVYAKPSRRRTFMNRDLHSIQALDFHAPTIPDCELAATVALNSHRVAPAGPRILMTDPRKHLLRARPAVAPDQAVFAKEQLLKVLSV